MAEKSCKVYDEFISRYAIISKKEGAHAPFDMFLSKRFNVYNSMND